MRPGMSAFITPILTTGKVIPVFPSVRCRIGPALSIVDARSTSVFPITLAAPAHRIGFTMNSRRFHSLLFTAVVLLTSLRVLVNSLWEILRHSLQYFGAIFRGVEQCNEIASLRPSDYPSLETILGADSTFAQFRRCDRLTTLFEMFVELFCARFGALRIARD